MGDALNLDAMDDRHSDRRSGDWTTQVAEYDSVRSAYHPRRPPSALIPYLLGRAAMGLPAYRVRRRFLDEG